MNLFVAWRDSLTILQPKNLKLFLLVTLKSIVDTFKVWIKYFWLLPVLYVSWISLILYVRLVPSEGAMSFFGTLNQYLRFIPVYIYIFIPPFALVCKGTLLLAARPSTALKNCAYFRSYFLRLLVAFFVMGVLNGLYGLVITMGLRYVENTAAFIFNYGLMSIGFLLFLYLINYTLFFFDGDGSFRSFAKSFIYAAKMTIFNLPFYVVVTLVSAVLPVLLGSFMLSLIMPYLNQASAIGIMIFMMIFGALQDLFTICLLTNFYVKKLHDQFTLYFGKNA